MLWLRSTIFNLCFFAWSFLVPFCFLPALLLPEWAALWVGRFYMHGLILLEKYILGLEYRVVGQHNMQQGGVIYASKHQSAWETLKVNILFNNPVVILKQELLWIPFWGWFAARMGLIGIDRGGGFTALRKMMRACDQALQRGRPIVIFPEGTRTKPGAAPDYKIGIAKLYHSLNVPVVPVALNSGVFWGRHAWVKKPGVITVEFLPAIPPGLPMRDFMQRLQHDIETACDHMIE